jgi:hypothetical protein
MPGFASYNDIINAVSASGKFFDYCWVKAGPAAQAAGQWMSLWYAAGLPGAGVDPATTPGTAYDNAAGSIFGADVDPEYRHLLTFGGAASVNCTLMLYDRLVGVSGLSLNATGDKDISSAALPRYADGIGVMAALELTVASTAAGAMTLSVYTNEHDQAAQAGPSFSLPAAATAVRTWVPVPLQAGDHGIKKGTTLNVATAATGAVVNFVLYKPIALIPLLANVWNERDMVLQLCGLPRLYDGHSLALAQMMTAVTATTHWGQFRAAYE